MIRDGEKVNAAGKTSRAVRTTRFAIYVVDMAAIVGSTPTHATREV